MDSSHMTAEEARIAAEANDAAFAEFKGRGDAYRFDWSRYENDPVFTDGE